LVPRRSWTRTPAASVARSVKGTMSVDFIVMGDCRSCRKSPNHVFHPHLASTTRTRPLAMTPSFVIWGKGPRCEGAGARSWDDFRPATTLQKARLWWRNSTPADTRAARARGLCLGCRLPHLVNRGLAIRILNRTGSSVFASSEPLQKLPPPNKLDVNHKGQESASQTWCSSVAARVEPGYGSARRHAWGSRTALIGRRWLKAIPDDSGFRPEG